MEILLLQDIPGVGKKNDLLVVGDGYALNNLLPQRKALVATPTVRKRYAEQIRRRAEEKLKEKALQESAAQQLAGKQIVFARKATKTGKLYAAISEKAIAEAMEKQLSIAVKENAVEIPNEIKALGDFQVHVKLGEHVNTLAVVVSQEK